MSSERLTRPPAPKESAAAPAPMDWLPGPDRIDVRADAPAAPVAPPVGAKSPARLLDLLTSAQRKEYPMATGLLDYFPDALAEISHVSYLGNQKHNPGQPLHWSREKSADHADCVIRHMTSRTMMDGSVPHLAEAAWRALADLQLELEKTLNLSPPAGTIPTR